MTNATTIPAADAVQWDALHTGAALADLSAMGRLRITGADALDLLNRLTTNKLEALPPGAASATVVTNGNGRVIDFLQLAALPDHMLCLTSPGRAQTVIDWLDTYTFGEDITVVDVSADTSLFAIAGPGAARALAAAGAADVPAGRDAVTQATLAGADAVLWRTLPGGADGFYLIADASQADALRDALTGADAVAVSEQTWDAYRIANGMPVYGAEFDESANPLEARLMGAISEDKGCYTGQEVIARLITYQKVQRRLMAVDLDAPTPPGAALTSPTEAGDSKGGDGSAPTGGMTRGPGAGKSAMTLTSSAVLPDGRCVGLALVPSALAVEGGTLEAEGGVRATLREPAYALATEPHAAE